MSRGQAGIEAMAVAVILVITFILVMIQTNLNSEQLDLFGQYTVKDKECLRIVSALQFVSSAPDNSQIRIGFSEDMNFIGRSIQMGGYYCDFSQNAIIATLSKGVVVIKKEGGILGVSN